MKLILSSLLLTTLAQSSRLLQQIDACSLEDCGTDECHVNPVNGAATCCAPDASCADADYQLGELTDVAICMDDGGLQKYDNKCFGRCDGNSACGILCECVTDADCATGYSCLETPFGFAGCDQNVGNSCFGFCATQRQGACGGFVGPAGCTAEETCYLHSTTSNSLGDCWSLPDSCPQVTPSPTVCGSIENCAVFSDSCNTCDCGVDGSATIPRCTEIACTPDQTVPYFCETCATGYEKDANGNCVLIPVCRRVENCASYSDGCSSCECNADGTVTCTRFDTCERDSITGEITVCRPCDPLAPPYSCDSCMDGYYLDPSTGECMEIPTCGGIDFCTGYTADSCGNGCSCDGREIPVCTLIDCPNPDPLFITTCTACIDGYKPSADGLSCEPDFGCFCPLFFDPVCCDGTTYGNTCQANCGGCSGVITPGACPTTCAATTCPVGQKCVESPANGAKCVDEDVCCTPLEEILAENPFACFEGCQCCPDGEWSGSIGDGKTFCGGLILGEDEFGTECESSIETVKCQTKHDCDPTYKCKKDPICHIDASINCGDVDRICVKYGVNNACSSDDDCNTNNGAICLLSNYIGICVNYQSPSP